MTKIVDWNKPIQTRDGHKARLVGTQENKYSHICVLSVDNGKTEFTACYPASGKIMENHIDARDIINVPEKKVRAKIYVYTGINSMINHSVATSGGYHKRLGDEYTMEFYREMTENEAVDRGLEYEVIDD